jgi:hypothetical protein
MHTIPHLSHDLVPLGCSSSEWDEVVPPASSSPGECRPDPRHHVVIQQLLGAR